MLFVFSLSRTFYYSREPWSHWTVVVLCNRTIQAESSLSKERLITIKSNIDRVNFKFLQTWCRGAELCFGSLVSQSRCSLIEIRHKDK